MTFIDILLLIALCWYGFRGCKNGLIYELSSIAALVLGCWCAYRFSDCVAAFLPEIPLAKPIALILTFTAVVLLVHLVGQLFAKIIKLAIPCAIDHLFGLLFGIGKVLVVSSIIFYIIQDLDRNEILFKKETKEKSITYQYIEPIIPNALDWDLSDKKRITENF